MKTVEIKQGSIEWHEHRSRHLNASDLPAAMGLSPYKSRDELIHDMAIGNTTEIDSFTQKIFDDGHLAEDLARKILEEEREEDLFPVVGTRTIDGLDLSTSYDGLTMAEDFHFEHKMLNQKLAAVVSIDELDDFYKVQMEQQLMVSGLDTCLFIASDGTTNGRVKLTYKSDQDLQKKIIGVWKQILVDVQSYIHTSMSNRFSKIVETNIIKELPAVVVQIKGEISKSNFSEYETQALKFIAQINTDLQSDRDFADAELTVKFCHKAEKMLALVKQSIIAQMSDINDLFNRLDNVIDKMASKRLTVGKTVKEKKAFIKDNIIIDARRTISEYINTVTAEAEFERDYLKIIPDNFSTIIKGKKLLTSIQSVINDEIARIKIEVNAAADTIKENLATIAKNEQYKFLFNDLKSIINNDNAHFTLIVDKRISEYERDQKDKVEQEKQAQKVEQEKQAQKVEQEKQAQKENNIYYSKVIKNSRFGYASTIIINGRPTDIQILSDNLERCEATGLALCKILLATSAENRQAFMNNCFNIPQQL